MATSRNDARAALLSLVSAAFDRVAKHVDAMPIETRTAFSDLETLNGTPRQVPVMIPDPTGKTEKVKIKGVETDRIVEVQATDENGAPLFSTKTDAPDLTIMIVEALASTGEVVPMFAGRTAGVWKGRVAKTAAKPGETVAKYKGEAERLAAQVAAQEAEIAELRAKFAKKSAK